MIRYVLERKMNIGANSDRFVKLQVGIGWTACVTSTLFRYARLAAWCESAFFMHAVQLAVSQRQATFQMAKGLLIRLGATMQLTTPYSDS